MLAATRMRRTDAGVLDASRTGVRRCRRSGCENGCAAVGGDTAVGGGLRPSNVSGAGARGCQCDGCGHGVAVEALGGDAIGGNGP